MKETMSTVGSTVGQIEKKAQQRAVRLFREQLGYEYLSDWNECEPPLARHGDG